MSVRVIAVMLTVGLLLGGPLQPLMAQAQSSSESPRRGFDQYDVGAVVITLVKVPFNVLLCGVGGFFAGVLFIATLGTGYKASVRTLEEGCGGPWIVSGRDIRPDPAGADTR